MNKDVSTMSKKTVSKPPGYTEFQLYNATFADGAVVDFTERKLILLTLRTTGDKRTALLGLLADYRAGRVAVAWQKGDSPVYVAIRDS